MCTFLWEVAITIVSLTSEYPITLDVTIGKFSLIPFLIFISKVWKCTTLETHFVSCSLFLMVCVHVFLRTVHVQEHFTCK